MRIRVLMIGAGCVAAACTGTPSTPGTHFPVVGTDLYAIQPEQITDVEIIARYQRLWAFKWRDSEPFSLVETYRSPARAATCRSGPKFMEWLHAVSRVPISGRPVRGVDPESPDWIQLRLTEGTKLEPTTATLFLSLADDSVLVAVGDSQYYARLDLRTAQVFRSGCAGMGAP